MTFDRDEADAFVRAHWRDLAAAGWNAYVLHGRGCVVVLWPDVLRWSDIPDNPSFNVRFGTDPDNPKVRRLVETYDPRTAIVLAFISEEDGVLDASIVARQPGPADAAAPRES